MFLVVFNKRLKFTNKINHDTATLTTMITTTTTTTTIATTIGSSWRAY
jgi:hypothetical protein